MKILRPLPPPGSPFYEFWTPLMGSVRFAGYFSQLISFLTEVTVIYAIILASARDWLSEDAGHQVALYSALVLSAMLEISLRKLLPYSVRAIIHKKFGGWDLVMTVAILLGTLLLIGSSGYLSFNGSRDVVDQFAPEVTQETTTAIDSVAIAKKQEAQERYQRDSAAIANRFAASINAQQRRLRNLVNRERRTDQSFGTLKDQARERIATLEAERADALASAWEVQSAETVRIAKLQETGQDSIAQLNADAIAAGQLKVDKYGGNLAYFTVVCLFILLVSIVLQEVYDKGSGVTAVAAPEQYDAARPVLAELRSAFRDRWNQVVRARIMAFAEKTKDVPLPQSIRPLIDTTELKNPHSPVEQEQADEDRIIIPIRRRIGFQFGPNDSRYNDSPSTGGEKRGANDSRYNDSPQRECVNCGTLFHPRQHNHKYCTTDCRLSHHAKQHGGRKFKPGKYHAKRNGLR